MTRQLKTPMDHVNQAAHIWQNFVNSGGITFVRELLYKQGVLTAYFDEGFALGEARREAYRSLRSYHGDPAYGGGRGWNHRENFDGYIIQRADNPDPSSYPGLQEIWNRGASVLRKYAASGALEAS